jgi:hypothetical protein
MSRVYGHLLHWKNDRLMVGRRWSGARIVPDLVWPKMWRVEFPAGRLSDMVNRTRAKDAAAALVLTDLNRQETAAEATPGGFSGEGGLIYAHGARFLSHPKEGGAAADSVPARHQDFQ